MDVTPKSEAVEVEQGVFLTQLVAGEEMSIQHVRMEPDAVVPQHSHHHEQVGFIYEGELTFLLADGDEVPVGAGESYWLSGDEIHGAENRGSTVVRAIDVFSPPRTDPSWQD